MSIEEVPLPLVVIDRRGRIVSANGHAADLFGYESGELLGRPVTEVIPELHSEGNGGLTRGGELRGVRRDGQELIVEISIGPHGGERELVFVRDLTAASRVREELREAEQRLRIAAEQTADFVFFADVEKDLLVALDEKHDHKLDAILGYEPGGFPRSLTGWLATIHPDDLPRIAAAYNRLVERGEKSWDLSFRIVGPDGRCRHWIDRGIVTEFVDGRANKGIGVVIDESDVVAAREELDNALCRMTEQSKSNEVILRALPGHLAVIDNSGTITTINDAWSEFGVENDGEGDAKLGVGANYLEACERARTSDSDAREALDGIRSVLSGSRSAFTMQYPCHSPSEKRWFSMTATPMKDGGAIVVHTNVTSEVAALQDLEAALSEITKLKRRLEAEGQYLREEIKNSHDFKDIVGSSPELLTTLHKLDRVAETNATVLLLGETGTGKELLARATHAMSKRNKRPLIKVDCTTLPPGLTESELFGHEKGAFTGAHESKAGRFELADGGTVFLDEVGELPLELQSKLLRVIQDGELERLGGKRIKKVDVRVIAATNRNLRDEVRAGRFREDLYYRLNVFPVEIPPLRDRREDIPALAMSFLKRRCRSLGRQIERIPTQTMEALITYDWPGNIRELQNVIERAIILSAGPELLLAEPLEPRETQPRRVSGVLRNDLEELERQQIVDALQASGWKIKGEGNAASRLGLKPSTLRSRMKRLGIERH